MSHGRSTTIAPPAQPTQFLSANTLARAMAPLRPRSGDLAPVKFDTVDDVPCQRFSSFCCDQNHKPASQCATCASQSRIIHGVTRDKRAGGVEPFFLRVRDQSVSLAHTLHLTCFSMHTSKIPAQSCCTGAVWRGWVVVRVCARQQVASRRRSGYQNSPSMMPMSSDAERQTR